MIRGVPALVNAPAIEVHYLMSTSAGPSHDGVKGSDQRSPCATRFSSAPIVACSTPAHAHVDDPFPYLSCGLGLHENSQVGLSEVRYHSQSAMEELDPALEDDLLLPL